MMDHTKHFQIGDYLVNVKSSEPELLVINDIFDGQDGDSYAEVCVARESGPSYIEKLSFINNSNHYIMFSIH